MRVLSTLRFPEIFLEVSNAFFLTFYHIIMQKSLQICYFYEIISDCTNTFAELCHKIHNEYTTSTYSFCSWTNHENVRLWWRRFLLLYLQCLLFHCNRELSSTDALSFFLSFFFIVSLVKLLN